MSVYTVHEPPLGAADASTEPDRFAFVRDGFHVWAFLLTPLWMLWRRMWLVFVVAIALVVVVDAAALAIGASPTTIFIINALISLLASMEAGTLQRWTLSRRGWKNVGLVVGDDLESAERRFFDTWTDSAGDAPAGAAAATRIEPPAATALGTATTPSSRVSHSQDVIGLFPQPGVPR